MSENSKARTPRMSPVFNIHSSLEFNNQFCHALARLQINFNFHHLAFPSQLRALIRGIEFQERADRKMVDRKMADRKMLNRNTRTFQVSVSILLSSIFLSEFISRVRRIEVHFVLRQKYVDLQRAIGLQSGASRRPARGGLPSE